MLGSRRRAEDTRGGNLAVTFKREKKLTEENFEKKEREISSLSQESEREKRERVCRR